MDTDKLIETLMRELDDAYGGVRTIPEQHPARLAVEAADEYLKKKGK